MSKVVKVYLANKEGTRNTEITDKVWNIGEIEAGLNNGIDNTIEITKTDILLGEPIVFLPEDNNHWCEIFYSTCVLFWGYVEENYTKEVQIDNTGNGNIAYKYTIVDILYKIKEVKKWGVRKQFSFNLYGFSFESWNFPIDMGHKLVIKVIKRATAETRFNFLVQLNNGRINKFENLDLSQKVTSLDKDTWIKVGNAKVNQEGEYEIHFCSYEGNIYIEKEEYKILDLIKELIAPGNFTPSIWFPEVLRQTLGETTEVLGDFSIMEDKDTDTNRDLYLVVSLKVIIHLFF